MIKETNVVLFTDTDTDITKELAKNLGYELISMPYNVDGIEIRPYIDFETFASHKFYQSLREGKMPKTGALSPIDYINYFEPIFKKGKDILYVHFSTAMSGTFNSMNVAYETLKETYPNRKLFCIDTKGVTINSLGLVIEISKKYNEGATIEELLEYGNKENNLWATYFFVERLDFFKRSGRVKSLAAFMGNIIGIKPIIYFDDDGLMNPISKARGTNNAIAKLIEYMQKLQYDVKKHQIIIGHTDCMKNVEIIERKIKEVFGNDVNILIVDVNPTIGSHCGPDGVGISFHAIHR